MEIKLTTDTTGHTVFKEYQLKIIEALALTGDIPIGNKAIWDYVLSWGIKISRASVINFVQGLHDLQLIKGVELTGKGGTRFEYTMISDRTLFDSQIASLFMDSLVQTYPDVQMVGVLSMSIMAHGIPAPKNEPLD